MGGIIASKHIYDSQLYQALSEKFVKAVGEEQYLPCLSVLNAEDLTLLTVTERKNSNWWFGKDKYYSTEFKLEDMTAPPITKSKVNIEPGKAFVKFNKMIELGISGTVEAQFRKIFGADIGSSNKVYINAPVGDVELIEVELQSLLNSINNSKLKMGHQLVKELAANKRKALCIVVGILKTVNECTLTACLDIDFKSQAEAGIALSRISASSGVNSDKSKELTIPAGIPLAYQIMELKVDKMGLVELMVSHKARGGFVNSVFDQTTEDPRPEFQLQPDALFAPFSLLAIEDKKKLLDDLKTVSKDPELLSELYKSLKVKKSTNESIQSILNAGKIQSLSLSILALVRALRDLSLEAQHQALRFSSNASCLPHLIEILSITYCGKSMSLKSSPSDHITKHLTESLEYEVKKEDDQFVIQTKGGVYSRDARSAYIMLYGIRQLLM